MLIDYKQYIEKNGEDMLEIRNWTWSASAPAAPPPGEP